MVLRCQAGGDPGSLKHGSSPDGLSPAFPTRGQWEIRKGQERTCRTHLVTTRHWGWRVWSQRQVQAPRAGLLPTQDVDHWWMSCFGGEEKSLDSRTYCKPVTLSFVSISSNHEDTMKRDRKWLQTYTMSQSAHASWMWGQFPIRWTVRSASRSGRALTNSGQGRESNKSSAELK